MERVSLDSAKVYPGYLSPVTQPAPIYSSSRTHDHKSWHASEVAQAKCITGQWEHDISYSLTHPNILYIHINQSSFMVFVYRSFEPALGV